MQSKARRRRRGAPSEPADVLAHVAFLLASGMPLAGRRVPPTGSNTGRTCSISRFGSFTESLPLVAQPFEEQRGARPRLRVHDRRVNSGRRLPRADHRARVSPGLTALIAAGGAERSGRGTEKRGGRASGNPYPHRPDRPTASPRTAASARGVPPLPVPRPPGPRRAVGLRDLPGLLLGGEPLPAPPPHLRRRPQPRAEPDRGAGRLPADRRRDRGDAAPRTATTGRRAAGPGLPARRPGLTARRTRASGPPTRAGTRSSRVCPTIRFPTTSPPPLSYWRPTYGRRHLAP